MKMKKLLVGVAAAALLVANGVALADDLDAPYSPSQGYYGNDPGPGSPPPAGYNEYGPPSGSNYAPPPGSNAPPGPYGNYQGGPYPSGPSANYYGPYGPPPGYGPRYAGPPQGYGPPPGYGPRYAGPPPGYYRDGRHCRGDRAAGTIVGGILGGVIGNNVARGRGRGPATVAGVILGGIAGNEIARGNCRDHRDRYYDDRY